MPSPFPGMNPYLENPQLWTEVHHLLIGILAETLNPQLLPHYRAAIEKRVYQMDSEDLPIEIREGYLEIREVATREVITVVELLSPTNKRPGKGRDTYEAKRREVLASRTHLVEIDLLRAGEPMPVSGGVTRNYQILVSRGDRRPQAELYAFNLQDPIPTFPLPLKAQEMEPIIDLHPLLDIVYDRAGYDVVIDYNHEPVPPLDEPAMTWTDHLLQQVALRRPAIPSNGQ